MKKHLILRSSTPELVRFSPVAVLIAQESLTRKIEGRRQPKSLANEPIQIAVAFLVELLVAGFMGMIDLRSRHDLDLVCRQRALWRRSFHSGSIRAGTLVVRDVLHLLLNPAGTVGLIVGLVIRKLGSGALPHQVKTIPVACFPQLLLVYSALDVERKAGLDHMDMVGFPLHLSHAGGPEWIRPSRS